MHGALALKDTETTEFSGNQIAPAEKWCALLTESNAERKACFWLRLRQYQPYWPRYKGTRKLNRHRRIDGWRSVIAGYIFLPLSAGVIPNWQLIEKTPGIRTIERPDGSKMFLNDDDMANLRRIEEALNASVVAAAKGIPFKVGENVRFTLGLRELVGTIIEIDKRGQITVETKLFERSVRMTIPASDIEAL